MTFHYPEYAVETFFFKKKTTTNLPVFFLLFIGMWMSVCQSASKLELFIFQQLEIDSCHKQ